MIHYDDFSKEITSLIDDGYTRFALYPFGEDGRIVKQWLKDYFDIEPEYIVDNGYCKYNKKIIDGQTLKNQYSDGVVVIITAQSISVREAIFFELVEYIPRERIIVLNHMDYAQKFSLSRLLPQKSDNRIRREKKEVDRGYLDWEDYRGENKDRAKVRFLCYGTIYFNSLFSVVEACVSDEEVDALVIISDVDSSIEVAKKRVELTNCRFVLASEYDICKDKPDILVLSADSMGGAGVSGMQLGTAECIRESTRKIVMVSHAVVDYGNWLLYNLKSSELSKLKIDYYCFDNYLYGLIKNQIMDLPGKCVNMGNPKYDLIYRACKTKNREGLHQKISEKEKIVTWFLDHGMKKITNDQIYVTDSVTIDRYCMEFLKYAKEHSNVGFVMRFHPTLLYELKNVCGWSEQDFCAFQTYIEESENVIIDSAEKKDYDQIIAVSDALLIDSGTGVVLSALPSNRPICVINRFVFQKQMYNEIVDGLYQSNSPYEMRRFLDICLEGREQDGQRRMQVAEKYVKYFDGNNGERILKLLKDILNERE